MITIQVPDVHEANMSAFLEGFTDAWWENKGSDFRVDRSGKQRHTASEVAYQAGQAAYKGRIGYLLMKPVVHLRQSEIVDNL